MPLSQIQIDVLRLLAAHRDPESYVATPLNRNTARYSDDIDVFHDCEERVAAAALHDTNVLEAAGYRVTWLGQRRGHWLTNPEIAAAMFEHFKKPSSLS